MQKKGKKIKYGIVPQGQTLYRHSATIDTTRSPKYGHGSAHPLFDSAILSEELVPYSQIYE